MSAQLSRQLAQALNQSDDDEGATEETTTSASAGENSQSPMKLKEVGDDVSADTDESRSRYLFVSFFGGDGSEYKIDISKAIDAGAVGRVPCEPTRDVLDRNNSAHQANEGPQQTTTCNGNVTADSTTPTKPKRKHPKLIESGPAEHIGVGWTYKTYQRMNGATEGQTDTYWFSPLLQKRFRSRKEIDRFMEFHRQAREVLKREADGYNYKINSMQCESIAWNLFKAGSSTSCGVTNKKERTADKEAVETCIWRFGEGLKQQKQQQPQNESPATLGPSVKPFGDIPHSVIPQSNAPPRHVTAMSIPLPQSQPVVMIPMPRPPPQFAVWDQHRSETVARGPISHPIGTAKKRPRDQEVMRFSDQPPGISQQPFTTHFELPPLSDFNYWLFSLINFKKIHGHIDVARHQETERDAMLLTFLNGLNERYCAYQIDPATLSIAQLEALKSIGMNFPSYAPDQRSVTTEVTEPSKTKKRWHPLKRVTFDERIEQLKQFKAKFGHCTPTKKESEDAFPGLAQWCMQQRSYMKKKMAGKEMGEKNMPDENENRLRDIGFDFTPRLKRMSWEERFEQLKRFKERHGHCKPFEKDCIDDFEGLFSWCKQQRLQFKKKMAGDDKIARLMTKEKEMELREIGFDFPDEASPIERETWEQQLDLEQLKQLRKEYM